MVMQANETLFGFRLPAATKQRLLAVMKTRTYLPSLRATVLFVLDTGLEALDAKERARQ